MSGAVLDQMVLKRGDTLPVFQRILKFDNGDVQDLTSSTEINFVYRIENGGVPDPDTAAVVVSCSIVNAPGTDGLVSVAFAASDTDVVADYLGEFEVKFGTDRLSFPNGKGKWIRFCVVQDAGDAP